MGKKALIKLLIILVVIGAIATILRFTGTGGSVDTVSSSEDKTNVFPDFPVNDIASITLEEKDSTITLNRGAEYWSVAERGDYPAKAETIISVLRGIWDMKIIQSPPIGKSQYGRVKLVNPKEATDIEEAASILRFKDTEGKELTSLWLGKVYERSENRPNPFGGGMATSEAGRYIKRGDKNNIYLVGQTFKEVESDPSKWLDETFFQVNGIKSISIKSGTPEEDWKLIREDESGDFKFAKAKEGEELDPAKTSSMKSAFANPSFEDILVGEAAAKNKADKTSFHLETFHGFTYDISVGEKNDLNELALTLKVSGKFNEKRVEGEEESEEEKKKLDEAFIADLKGAEDKLATEKSFEGIVYKVRSYVVDSIAKKRSELLKDEAKEGAATPGGPPPSLPGGIQIPGLPPGGGGNQ